MGVREIESFLSHLATTGKVSAATQRQALNAIVFLYKHVLNMELSDAISLVRTKRRARLPVVMSREETQAVLHHMQGLHLLMAQSLYGAGLRLMEFVPRRVNSIDIQRGLIYVRFGKGNKDRTAPIPKTLFSKLQYQLESVGKIHAADLRDGYRIAWLPPGFARKIGSAA